MRVVWLRCEDYAEHTGGFVYNNRLAAALAVQAGRFLTLSVPAGFPSIAAPVRARLAAAFAALPPDTFLVGDHLHFADLAPELAQRHFRVAAVFHHARSIEDTVGGRQADRAAEQRGFDACDCILVSSQTTATYVQCQHGVLPQKIVVAIPGDDPVSRSPGPSSATRLLVTVGAVIPRKRHDYLAAVATRLRAPDWQWIIAGDLARDPEWMGKVRAAIDAAGLRERVRLAGAVSGAELESLWQRAGVCVAASHYEGYGMALAEALRRGVPVVTTASGAVGEWARGGVVIAPDDDAETFARALDVLLLDPAVRQRMSDAAWAFGSALPTWAQTFSGIAGRLAEASGSGSAASAA